MTASMDARFTIKSFVKAVSPPILLDIVRPLTQSGKKSGRSIPLEMLPDAEFYRPHFSPWEGLGEFKDVMASVAPNSLVTSDRVWVLYSLAKQARHIPGNFWECGVFKGGTASALARVVRSASEKQLRLFDTFSGVPDVTPGIDFHRAGTYFNTSVETVKGVVGEAAVSFHAGLIPDTFADMESETIALAHIDVVLYQSVLDCCSFIYPRLSPGGFMIFDDYGFRSCPGARAAVDEYFADKPEELLVLPTRQGIIVKMPY